MNKVKNKREKHSDKVQNDSVILETEGHILETQIEVKDEMTRNNLGEFRNNSSRLSNHLFNFVHHHENDYAIIKFICFA